MNKENTLLETFKQWDWLAKNPRKTKHHYTSINKHSSGLLHDCYLCEYVNDHYKRINSLGDLDCEKCLLSDEFRNDIGYHDYPCENVNNSPYNIWFYENSYGRKSVRTHQARRLATMAILKFRYLKLMGQL